MFCPAQKYAYDILKEYPLDKWIKYRDCVYILHMLDDEIVILIGNYGYAPSAYKSWIKSSCSEILMKFDLDVQISFLQEKYKIPVLKKNIVYNSLN